MPALLKAFFAAIQQLRPQILAYHDRADGGLFATVCEMSFAGHLGVSLNLDALCYDPLMNDVDGIERMPEILDGRMRDRMVAALFNEELGAVIQIRRADRGTVMQAPARRRPRRLHAHHRHAQRCGRDPRLAQRKVGAGGTARRAAAGVERGELPGRTPAR